MEFSYKTRLLIVLASIIILGAGGLLAKKLFLPESFGIYGSYRADAIDEEVLLPIKHGTNASCFSCHPYEAKIHKIGRHQTISCEFCHGTYADHVTDNKKTGTLPVKKDKEITTLCLRCHNTEIKARKEAVIKTVAMPDHLQSQHVKLSHNCNQCHHVHAPLKYIIRAKEIMGMMEAES